jgi:death-on-curing protein
MRLDIELPQAQADRNGCEIVAAVDDQERLMLDLAAGRVTREQLTEWLGKHLTSP